MSFERVDFSPKTPSPTQLVQSVENASGSDQRRFQRRSIENDICLRCNKKGHWARDCPLKSGRTSMPLESSRNSIDDPDFPPKRCPCGGGVCLILTSKTEKNPGRKFYSCPATGCRKCNFFEWCDNASLDPSPDVADPPPPMCPCGAGVCQTFTTKMGRHAGRKFFVCCVKKGQGACNFFQWQDSLGKDCDMIHGLSHESIQVNNSSSISHGEKDIGAATDCKEGGDGFKLQALCCNGSHEERPLLSTCDEGFRVEEETNHLQIEEFSLPQDWEKYINEFEELYCSGKMGDTPSSSSGVSFQMERGNHPTIETSNLHEKGEEQGSNGLDDMLVDESLEECLLSICNEGKEEEGHLAMDKLSLCEAGKNYFEELEGLFSDWMLEIHSLSSSPPPSSSMEVSKVEAGHFLATEGIDLYEEQEKHDGYGPNNMLYTGLNEEWSPSMHDEAFEVNQGTRNALIEKFSLCDSGMDYFNEQSRTLSNLTMEKGSALSFGEEFEGQAGHWPPIKRLSFHEEGQHGNGPMDASFRVSEKEYPLFTFDEEFQVREQTDGSNSLYPTCSCGSGICKAVIIIGGRNDGHRFVICPVPKGQGACGFFAWQDSPSESNDTTDSLSDESMWLNCSQSISDNENDPLATTGDKWGEESCWIALLSGSLEKGSSSSCDEVFLVEEERDKMVIKNLSLCEAVEADLKGKPQKAPSSGFGKGPSVSPSSSTTIEGFQVDVGHHPLIKQPNLHEVDDQNCNGPEDVFLDRSDKIELSLSPSEKCQVEETDRHPVIGNLESCREAAVSAVAQPGKCFRCGKAGHLTKECARSLICFKCGKVGHQKKDCTSQTTRL